MARCLKNLPNGLRCQIEAGDRTYCVEHERKRCRERVDKLLVVQFCMMLLAYVLGYWTHAWALPWLRGG
jgi:hypothetical protein